MRALGLKYGHEFRRCMVELDTVTARRLWKHVHPELSQPQDDDQTLIMLHTARVNAGWLSLALRQYSRTWLDERLGGQPTGPLAIETVGYATNTRDTGLREALTGGVSRTVAMALAGGVAPSDRKELHPLMMDARAKVKSGRISI
jgi:hypothetical protein